MNGPKCTLVVIEAIDGGGKGTVAERLARHAHERGHEVLHVVEPTSLGLGKFIREELTAQHADGHGYPARAAAIAFSMDREALYLEKVLPFLSGGENRVVIQERSVLSALVYQPVQDPSLTTDWLLSLEGNRLELSRPPDLLIVLRVDAETAMERLAGRKGKRDNSIFERTDFQRRTAERYRDPSLLAPYVERGTRIVEVNSGQPLEAVVAEAREALDKTLPGSG